MIFNSIEFLFFFLPITFLGSLILGFRGYPRVGVAWVVTASLFFYGWWNPIYLFLIISSIVLNYQLGKILSPESGLASHRKLFLILGISFNLGLLGYYKYANFFINNINLMFESNFTLEPIILPLAISFFTFQQIAFLADNYYGITREQNFLNYCFFVSFFPQLIAGPIVQHREVASQINGKKFGRPESREIAVGLSIFFIGLFKKVVIADSIAVHSTPVFQAAELGHSLKFFEAWGGCLGYTFQIYFDFSGYSDMAVGLAQMFGIRLPINFFSPYKSVNIIQFWRRWHITLSRFLRLYFYIPLGGNRRGKFRQFLNIIITMFLGGLWHGANWTFVLWGVIHGLYLVMNHIWGSFWGQFKRPPDKLSLVWRTLSRLLTFLSVAFAWVLFRADSIEGALEIYKAMLGINGIQLSEGLKPHFNFLPSIFTFGRHSLGNFGNGLIKILLLVIVTFAFPNTQQFMQKYLPSVDHILGEQSPRIRRIQWRPTMTWAIFMAIISLVSMTNILNLKTTEFLYFQF